MMRYVSKEQQLVDIMFQVALMCAERMHGKTNEEIAKWVAHQLRECGFDTYACGASWGVLK